MAEKWEELFKTVAEATHSITQLIEAANEGDDLHGPYKEIEGKRDEVVKAAEGAPSDIPDFDDEGAQLELKNAADTPVVAGNKLLTALEEKRDVWMSKKDLGKIVKEVIHTNNAVLEKPYPAANPYSPEITGKTKKLEAESNRLAKQHTKAEAEAAKKED
ncbi:hypothetical protein AC579_8542 [Pseudocercospora musae]|uniref:Uncharacterized protein n=1 Tax=Pseudocercospora musae TaxID=113226 RepID=A0A139HCS8_9PEZI|nr:hypothetical protein AC579_8542 [Pseudocercospora musae]